MIKYNNFNVYMLRDFLNRRPQLTTDTILKCGRGNKNQAYINTICTFDTETSHNHDSLNPVGWVYQWAFLIGSVIVCGRKPSEFIELLNYLINYYNLYTVRDEVTQKITSCRRLKFFVHNLSYDLQYLKEFLHEHLERYKQTNLNYHKVLNVSSECFEIVDTMALSGRSLDNWSKDLKTPNYKLIGSVNYDLIRFQDDILTVKDWKYIFNDVIVLRDCVFFQNRLYGDSILTMPPTKTSYVRRIVKRNFKQLNKFERDRLTANNKINETLHALLRCAFAGGYTHLNRHFTDSTIKGNIKHRDFVSFYSFVMLACKFPGSIFNKISINPNNFIEILKTSNEYAYIISLVIDTAEILPDVVMPYLQDSHIRPHEGCKIVRDNGRILSVVGEFGIVLTELDLLILVEQYKIKRIKVCDAYRALKKPLPEYVRQPVIELFRQKQELKHKLKFNKDHGITDFDTERNYKLIKEQLNSIPGMLETNPVRQSYNFDFERKEWTRSMPEMSDIYQLFQFMQNDTTEKNFNKYQHGVYVTANARYMLFKVLNILKQNSIYSDTDSAFYFSTPKIEQELEAFNKKIIEMCEQSGAYIDTAAGREYMGLFELENEEITEFRGLHSKCYGYRFNNAEIKDKLSVTIAGVPKVSSRLDDPKQLITREQEIECLKNLTTGFTFNHCGGLKAHYIEESPKVSLINGHAVEHAGACILERCVKTLNAEMVEDNPEAYAFNEESTVI